MINKIKHIISSYILISSILVACPPDTNCFIPEADAGDDKIYYINSTVTLDGSSSSDPEGADLTYSWTSQYGAEIPTCEEYVITVEDSGTSMSEYLVQECQDTGGVLEFAENMCLDIFGYEDENLQSDCEMNGFSTAIYNSCLSSQYSDYYPCEEMLEDEPPSSAECSLLTDSYIVYLCDIVGIELLESLGGMNLDGANPSFDLDASEELVTISLVVNDGDYNSNSDDVNITVVNSNTAPVIDVVTSLTVNKNSEFIIDASMTNDDSSLTGVMNFSWSGDIGTFVCSGENTSILTCTSPDVIEDANYIITLMVSDSVDSDSQNILIEVIANQKPVSIPGPDQEVKLGTIFELDGTNSYDPEGSLLSYEWSIPSNFTIETGTINDALITVSYDLNTIPSENEHIFSLVVNDGTDDSDTSLGEDIFISDYCEHPDDTDGRYFEIYNPTNNAINLDGYELWRLNNGGDWGDDGSNTTFSLTGEIIQAGEAIAITRRDENNSDASELIDFNNISYIHWSNFNPGGDDAIGIAKEGLLIDAIGGPGDPGSAWDVAGFTDATKDGQIIRKATIFKGNINSDCMVAANQNENCWEISAGTSVENSDWLYKEDATDGEQNGIADVNSFDNAGKHYCAVCDNYLKVNLTTNSAPIAAINDDFIVIDNIWTAPWEVVVGSTIVLDATNSSDPEGVSLTYLWLSEDIDIIDSSSSTLSLVIPDSGLEHINIELNVNDGVNSDVLNIQINIADSNLSPTPTATFISMSYDGDIIAPNSIDSFYEGHEVIFSASNSVDDTYTGLLSFSWELAPADIEIASISSTDISITMPEYISNDKSYILILSVTDGVYSTSINYPFTVEARMPIIGIIASEVDGFEGEYVKVDASSTINPGGGLEELAFDWKPGSLISGYCSNNIDISCQDAICTTGTCMNDMSTAFVYIDKSIGFNTTYNITVSAENNQQLESLEEIINVNVIAQYPVSNSGLDKTYTAGTLVTLDGYRSYDPQEDAVSFSYWDEQTDGTFDWEEGESIKIISFYNEIDGLIPKDGYLFTWTAPEGIELSASTDVNPTFTAPDDSIDLEFSLSITDVSSGYTSLPTIVEIEIVDNEAPIAVVGNYRIYNEGELEERYLYGGSSDDPLSVNTLRAMVGQEYQLIGENSFDDTPYGNISYSWTAPAGIELSNATIANPVFQVPETLCSDEASLDEISCCVQNEGIWTASQTCEGSSSNWINQSDPLSFTLEVSDGQGLSSSVVVPLVYSLYSAPIQPSLYATRDHEVINLFWDTKAPNSIDNLTGYADFQGYKIYRSTDYGQTWGDAIYDNGTRVGWKPYVQYDLSAAQDSTYCLYKNDFIGCEKNDKGLDVAPGTGVNRYDEISGNVDWYEGYFWQDLGSNTGLAQAFIDEDVIDGVDYTYTITSYDSGVRPDTLQYGHFGELSGSTWNPNTWIKDEPIYTFREVVEADSFYFFHMNHQILESYIDDGKHMYRLEVPSEWNVGALDEIISSEEVSEGVKIWDTNRVWPISNPDEFSAMYSTETTFGSSTSDQNFVTISPGFYASNVSFPEIEDLDTFIAADCEAIGDGNRFYEIVNEADLSTGYIKLEIQANSGINIFENYTTEDACLYAYKVQKNISLDSPVEYISYEIPDGENGLGYLQKYELINNGNSFIDDDGLAQSINSILGLPGVSLGAEYIYMPNYLIECHQLSYLDDPGFDSNWTEFFDGVRMRFDNSLREEPDNKSAALKEVYSYPDSSLAELLYSDQTSYYGDISLKYYTGAFSKKPSYEYEIELSNDFIDQAVFSTTDVGGGPQEKCGRSFSTSLPFKIKNLTTGKYVRVAHTDFGIWNNVATVIPSWFSTPDDPTTHPGYGDCVWSPGEWISFYYDDVTVGDSQSTEETPTFNLELSFNGLTVFNYKNEKCPSIVDYDETVTYPSGSCINHAGNVWYATSDIKPSDNGGLGFSPNSWYNDDDSLTEENINPWSVVYPWSDEDKIVIKPQKWFVDGDYWIADMSLLGASDIVVQSDIDQISVVPNPYIISSKFNEDVNSNRIRFTHLPQQCTISIYTISGEAVHTIVHNDNFDSNEFWNLKNSKNKKVAPGLYIYKVDVDNGISKVGKFAIVR